MFTFTILFILFVLLLVLYTLKCSKERPKNFPPGLPKLPFYGSYLHLLWANYKYFYRALEYYGKKYNVRVLGYYLGNTPSVAVFDYDLCKEVLTRDEFVSRPSSIILTARGYDELPGVIFGDNWREQKWIGLRYMRDFGFGRRSFKVEDYTEGEVKNLIELFTSEPTDENKDVCCKKGIVKMPNVLQGHLINILSSMLTSTRYDYFKLRELARSLFKFIISVDISGNMISIAPWLRFIAPDLFSYTSAIRDNKPMLDFLKEEIAEHKKTFISGYPRDFIDIYLEELEKIKGKDVKDTSVSEKEMLFTMLDFMFPAPIGIGHTLNFLFSYLIYYPDVQVKIQNEIDTIVGKSRLPNLNDRKDLAYVEATIREVIRINTISPLGISRKAVVDTELDGYFIPKNTSVIVSVSSAHFDRKLYRDPENFRPERWLDNNGRLTKDTTIGFGAGKRICAGETFSRQTIFLIVSGLLQQFTFRTPENYERPDLNNLIPGIILCVPEYYMEAVVRDV